MGSTRLSGLPEIFPLPLFRAKTHHPPSRGSGGTVAAATTTGGGGGEGGTLPIMMHLRPSPFEVDIQPGKKYMSPKQAQEPLEMQERSQTSLILESLAIPSARPSIETPRPSIESSQNQPSQQPPQSPKPWWMSRRRTLPIRERVQSILDERFPSHYNKVPRLFIALPDDPMTTPRSGTDDFQRLQRFRVYFLCECGIGWTRPLGSGLNHAHIGRHGGYAIAPDRQEAFFRENGPMILALLLYLWHGNEDSVVANRSSIQHRRSESGMLEAANSSTPVLLKEQEHHGKKSRHMVAPLHEIQTMDLPKAIQQDVQVRFRTMIDFLVGLNPELYLAFQEPPPPTSETKDGHSNNDNHATKPSKSPLAPAAPSSSAPIDDDTLPPLSSATAAPACTMWSYPVSLSDMRRLYGYIGLHSPQLRQEHEANGDLVRVTNLHGDATWVCASHYRWTFYNSEVDSFFHWVESRGGTIDKQTGAVMMSIVSSDQLVRLCDWIIAKSGAALIELHLKLQWRFNRKDLWKLGRAVAKTNINILTLDGCMHHEDSGLTILNKRHDPLLRMLEVSRLQCLELSHFPSLFRRLSSIRVHAPMIERLVFGPGVTSMTDSTTSSSSKSSSSGGGSSSINTKSDLASLASVLASCPNLRELVVPGLILNENQASHLVDGLVTRPLCQNLSMLDLSRSAMNDGVAYRLAAGLDVTQIQHLNVSHNPFLSDRACARLIDGMRWRLASLGMAQTGFGDRAMLTLISYLEGSENSSQGGRNNNQSNNNNNNTGAQQGKNSPSNKQQQQQEQESHPPCPLVSLDIANNQCSRQAFQALARVQRPPWCPPGSNNNNNNSTDSKKAPPRLVSLDFSLSSHLTDVECSQIVEKFVSPNVSKLRLAFCSVGDQTAKALASILLLLPCHTACRLEELELQGNSMTAAGVASLARALREVAAWTSLQTLELSHGSEMDDAMAQTLLQGLIEADPFLTEMSDGPGAGTGTGTVSVGAVAAATTPLVVVTNPQQQHQSLASCGFFSVLTELNLSSTKVGDETACIIARALAQSWVALETLSLLEPEAMTELGMATILDALALNNTVLELGIGSRSGGVGIPVGGAAGLGAQGLATSTSPTTATAAAAAAAAEGVPQSPAEVALAAMDPLNQVDLFGTALFRLLESNRRIRTLTTIGAPIQAIARGLMFNKTLVSLYLIKSRGSYEDMQAMGDSVAHHRSLLVLWMGGSDESLLCPMVSVDTRDSVGGGIGGGQGQDGTGGQGGGGGGADGKDGHPSHRFGRFWHGDSLQDVDGLQNSTTRSGRWLDGRSSTAHRRRNRRKGVHSISFAGILPKSFRLATATRSTDYHQEMTFHPTTNHYNTVRKNPYMWSTGPNSAGGGGGGGGMAQSVIPRNPLVDGIRRNHRLIKIRIDPMPTTTPFSSSPLMSREAGGYGGSTGPFPATLPMQRKSTTQSVTFSHYNTVTTRSTTQASARGVGGGGLSTALRATLSPPALPKPMVLNVATTAPTADSAPTQASAQAPAQAPTTTALSSPPQPTSRHAHPPPPGQLRRSSVSYQSLAAVQDQAQQQERMVQQQLAKKMAANRAALRDHSRIGAEELRMLRIDEDIIREVCSDIRK